jgi:hypothetical protein
LNLQQRFNKEAEQNKKLIESKTEQIISYGSEVMFQHEDSEYFISAKMECAMTDKIGYKCELSNALSNKMVFTINPKYKSRLKGDFIQHSDFVFIQNIKNSHYLSVSLDLTTLKTENRQDGIGKIHTIKDKNPLIPEKNFLDPSCTKNPIYLGQEPEFSWQCFLNNENLVNSRLKKGVCGGNLVTIKHVEAKGYLSADIAYGSTNYLEVFFKVKKEGAGRVKGHVQTGSHDGPDINSLWQIEYIKNEIPGSQITFRLREESDEGFARGDDEIGAIVRFRHFLSGRLMGKN